MARLRKLIIHNTLVEICFRTEEGLPLVATPYMQVLLLSIFARAQSMFPVKFCHGLVMPNHMHLHIVVQDTSVVDKFVGYIKRETAHAINRLMGRRKKTIWAEGYDSTIILDAEKAISRIKYIYTNPQQANLVEKIDEYPNFSTWKHFLNGGAKLTSKRIKRNSIMAIAKGTLRLKDQQRFAEYLQENENQEYDLIIEPNAWMECFPNEAPLPESTNRIIIDEIRKEERRLNSNPSRKVIGAPALKLERMDRHYIPKKRGRKTICLSSNRELRVSFVSWYKLYISIIEKIKYLSDPSTYLTKLPPGLFAPGGFMKASLLPDFLHV
jgi:REP element-mobilizing transposase RayT